MPNYRKSSLWIYYLGLVWFNFGHSSFAADSFVKIETAHLEIQQNTARLTVKLDFHLSVTAQEALHSGIPLFWDVSIALQQSQWHGLWYKTLFAQSSRYSLSYYTLLNNYRLKDEYAQVFRRFSSLSEALIYMRHIVYADMLMQDYDPGQCVTGVLNVTFDREMLPAPLRPIAYFDEQWNLSAQERQWCD